jgi:hypothetical protein
MKEWPAAIKRHCAWVNTGMVEAQGKGFLQNPMESSLPVKPPPGCGIPLRDSIGYQHWRLVVLSSETNIILEDDLTARGIGKK